VSRKQNGDLSYDSVLRGDLLGGAAGAKASGSSTFGVSGDGKDRSLGASIQGELSAELAPLKRRVGTIARDGSGSEWETNSSLASGRLSGKAGAAIDADTPTKSFVGVSGEASLLGQSESVKSHSFGPVKVTPENDFTQRHTALEGNVAWGVGVGGKIGVSPGSARVKMKLPPAPGVTAGIGFEGSLAESLPKTAAIDVFNAPVGKTLPNSSAAIEARFQETRARHGKTYSTTGEDLQRKAEIQRRDFENMSGGGGSGGGGGTSFFGALADGLASQPGSNAEPIETNEEIDPLLRLPCIEHKGEYLNGQFVRCSGNDRDLRSRSVTPSELNDTLNDTPRFDSDSEVSPGGDGVYVGGETCQSNICPGSK
ncbi:MAG: hypothetical protein K2X34_07575, partial [Hyphomonadaceae bacterium]|nr:hypothetical protein [Hyphomonadaceae bacterium]MBY0421751.1 hypothetical protein [Parvularculaceae bacterium]